LSFGGNGIETIDDFPNRTPVKIVILAFGNGQGYILKIISRAPRISMNSWGMFIW